VGKGVVTVASAVLSGKQANKGANALRTAHTTAFDVLHHRAKAADDFLQTTGDLA
jgi:hypothetical protein